ncbi:hypoxanthine phosphoribosyltransferase [Marinilongibacter aquaticus]|uniref:hypoxanthine phosphoribosyltransferase n=1 Tax=Marinilongibacter aquaticus TaxID=2975157 RepID=UPI0021BD0758|nr:hypoxanthine phosphoribosyltransferase [Marinilongibacter aquaticus]UBM60151.1 hypoxanthine phosphoribosyltransferase [Marinilongibacter aquaticus]
MITIKNKQFVRLIPKEKIQARTAEIAQDLNTAYADKNPIFLGVLNGCFMFLAEMFKHIEIPCQVSFTKVQSYESMQSSGKVLELIGIPEDVKGRHVVLVEDIIDTGLTMQSVMAKLKLQKPSSISVVTLLHKAAATKIPLQIDHVGFVIENNFVVGFGLDFDGYGRNYEDILVVSDQANS